MSRILPYLAALAAVAATTARVSAFSLLGEVEAWQTPELSYQFPGADEIGASKNLGEEYRRSSPVLTYGFDASFVDYFGAPGIAAVESAFAAFNALPAASAMSADLSEFPLNTRRINRTAAELSLVDLKSTIMGGIMEQLGVLAPERWVFGLRDIINRDGDPWTGFVTHRRNFDPVTFRPSSYINGSLYSYEIFSFFIGSTRYYDAREFRVDPSRPNTTVALWSGTSLFLTDDVAANQVSFYGSFVTGLTRDDAGALRYIYHPSNRNFEQAPAGGGLPSGATVTVVGTGGSGGAGQSPWNPVVTAIGAGGGTDPNNPGATNTVVGPAFAAAALRNGADKVSFVRVDLDPLLRTLTTPLAVRYQEVVVGTNGSVIRQTVQRRISTPDILISAADLNGGLLARGLTLVNNSAADGISTLVKGGPGNVDGTTEIILNRTGRLLLNRFLGETEEDALQDFHWGSFDGTTNAPIVFPVGRVTLSELEQAALGGN